MIKTPASARLSRLAAILGAVCGGALMSSAYANELYFQMNPNLYSSGVREAFIFGAANATGTLTSTDGVVNTAFNLGAQGFSVLSVPQSYELASNTIQNNGFKIQSGSNVSGYFLNRAPQTTDMTYLIDGSKLGTNYVVAAYSGAGSEQLSAQATQNNTTVTINAAGGSSVTKVLNAGQTYMISGGGNLTGSTVTADKPIAVFSGNSCANIPGGNTYCDHIVEQMPSIAQLSKTYYVAPTPRTGANGDVVRIVASADATEVKVDGVVLATLNAGQFSEIRVPVGKTITADKPILVAQYLIGQTEANANTDPAMTIVPGADQWLKSYVFATPSGSADFPTDYISLILATSDVASLRLDGAAIADPFTALGGGYSFANVDVSGKSGPFSITAGNPFQLLLSGYDAYDTYFTYGGAVFAPGASEPPPVPNGVPEPGSVALLGLGLAVLAGLRRQRSA